MSVLLILTERKLLIEIITKIDRHNSKYIGILIEKAENRFVRYYEKTLNSLERGKN